MNGLYVIQNLGFVFLGIFFLVALVYFISRKTGPARAGREKRRIYACGEDESPEDLNVVESGFFAAIGKVLGIQKLRNFHSGDLSSYLTWIFIGLMILIMIMVMMW